MIYGTPLQLAYWKEMKFSWNLRALTEQYVLQQLISDTPYTPYYYGTEKATFEQDFLIQKDVDIVPIEVKAETNIKSRSLKSYCDKFHPK